jgi:hypothetical protein
MLKDAQKAFADIKTHIDYIKENGF